MANRRILDTEYVKVPKEVRYCAKCVVSTQRPRMKLDDKGVCSACNYAYEKKHVIKWENRRKELEELCNRHRRNDGQYDVIVPCSGGKDASMVAYRLKHDYGMHPLTVTWAPLLYTDIGWRNLQSFVRSGFSNLLMQPNQRLNRRLARIGFESIGDTFAPFCYGQMCLAFHIALHHNVKLVFFGENGEAEYGGSTADNDRPYRPVDGWAAAYWKGVSVDNLIEWGKEYGLITDKDYDPSDLLFYRPPSLEILKERDIQMHWFSYYHKWVPQENFYCASEHTGFQANPDGRSEGTYSKYASLDDKLDGLHYYMMFIKFGIGRATSDAAHEIRDGHLTREEGVALVRRFDGEFPAKYLKDCLEYMDLPEREMWEIIEKYRQPHLWKQENGAWKLRYQIS